MSNLKINHLLTLSILSIGLTACGGGSSGGGSGITVYNGVFKDSTVSGLSYVSGDQKGTTGTNGEFKYEEDSTISFSVGGVVLGIGTAKNVMTPIDLVDKGTLETPAVLNRVRFLMMLDKDNNPDNGIEISNKVQTKAKSWSSIDFSEGTFPSETAQDIRTEASVEDGVTHKYKTSEEAKTHFSSTLEVIKATERCADAGAFTGTFSGSESGNIAFILDPSSGEIIGSLFNTDSSANHIPVEITSESAIDYDTDNRSFTSLSTGIKLSGQLISSNSLEGTWVNEEDETIKGTFVAKRIGGNAGANYRYNALYEGSSDNDLGILAIDVDSKKRLTGNVYDVKSADTYDVTGSVKFNEFSNISVSDGGQISIFTTETKASGTFIEKSTSTNSFAGNGCELN